MPKPPPPPPTCAKCGQQGGRGWVFVSAKWVDSRYPMPERPIDCSDEQWARLVAEVEARRDAAANTAYPCPECNKGAFYRWAAGHHEPGHDASLCDECQDLRHPNRRGARTPHPKEHEHADAGPRRDF